MTEQLANYGTRARMVAEERADWRRNAPAMLEAYAMALTENRGAE
jgi:hypothetical protein